MDIGVEFGAYRIIDRIGRGGMADVWSARDKRLSRTVAIKTVARALSSDIDPIKLFEREAKTIARLEHPHILPIYEFGEYQGQLYIVMRYVSGGSLEALLQNGGLPLDDMLRLARLIAQALDYAHANQIVHLDLKPSNILLDSYQSPYLADFGLAAVIGPEGRAINPGSGTLLYMAPEQLTSEKLDSRADVYAYCVMIYHMMTGQLPFDGAIPLAIRQLQTSENLPDIRELLPDMPPAITEILRHGTRLDIEKRAVSVMDIFTRLESALTGVVSRTTQRTRTIMPEMRTTQLNVEIMDRQRGDLTTDLDVDMLGTKPFKRGVSDSEPDFAKTRTDFESSPLNVAAYEPRPTSDDRPATVPLPSEPIAADVDATGTINISDSVTDAPIGVELPDIALELLPPGTDLAARSEALVIYTRARRAWAGGQGKFLLGITPFMLMDDYYSRAEAYQLDIDDVGKQMMLRGALEYDYKIDEWWAALDDTGRRWVSLHALRSENATARLRAVDRLCGLPDAAQPLIPNAMSALLTAETNMHVTHAAIRALKLRGIATDAAAQTGMMTRLDNPDAARAANWRETVFSAVLDRQLGDLATKTDDPVGSALAARAIGAIRSRTAALQVAQAEDRAVRRALALIRDEAASLPATIPTGARFAAWLTNTARRITSHPSGLVARFLWATLGGWIGMATYIWLVTPALPFLDPARLGLTLSVGLSFGVIFGFQVLFASEIPMRLRGFWYAWARGLLSLIFGLSLATFGWAAFTYLYLLYPPENNVIAVGVGTAVALAIPVMLRLPPLINILLLVVGLFIPIYDAWVNYRPPLLYVQDGQNAALIFGITLMVISVGAYVTQIMRRKTQQTRTT